MAIKKYLGSAVRHLLTVIVGILIASSVPGASIVGEIIKENLPVLEPAIASLLGYLAIQFWSWLQKWRSAEKDKDAVVISKDEYRELLSKKNE